MRYGGGFEHQPTFISQYTPNGADSTIEEMFSKIDNTLTHIHKGIASPQPINPQQNAASSRSNYQQYQPPPDRYQAPSPYKSPYQQPLEKYQPPPQRQYKPPSVYRNAQHYQPSNLYTPPVEQYTSVFSSYELKHYVPRPF